MSIKTIELKFINFLKIEKIYSNENFYLITIFKKDNTTINYITTNEEIKNILEKFKNKIIYDFKIYIYIFFKKPKIIVNKYRNNKNIITYNIFFYLDNINKKFLNKYCNILVNEEHFSYFYKKINKVS